MYAKEFLVGNKKVGLAHPTYFIADIAANWDGSLERAKDLICLAAEAGADAAKFQNFQAATIISSHSFENMGGKLTHQKSWKKSVFEVYDDASLPEEWTEELKKTCDDNNIHYFTTPYSLEVVDKVKDIVEAWKVGSGDVAWHDHIERMASHGKPIFIATGASTLDEVKMAVSAASNKTDEILLMQCNTNYTASLENFKHINLRVLNSYANIFPGLLLGLSDHTPGHSTVLGAVALGARAVEKHFTDDTSREGPDHKFSMDPKTWYEMVQRTRELEYSMGDGIKKIEDNEVDSYVVQRRSIHASTDLAKGHILQKEDLVMLRPELEDSFKPYEIDKLIGKELLNDIVANQCIRKQEVK
ncbi:N-acetylneuraminate synthase family protein [Pseudomonadota bacterium]|nr:N-acetylneuraminate synthase family protein [Pseudomonadota bacterium]